MAILVNIIAIRPSIFSEIVQPFYVSLFTDLT